MGLHCFRGEYAAKSVVLAVLYNPPAVFPTFSQLLLIYSSPLPSILATLEPLVALLILSTTDLPSSVRLRGENHFVNLSISNRKARLGLHGPTCYYQS